MTALSQGSAASAAATAAPADIIRNGTRMRALRYYRSPDRTTIALTRGEIVIVVKKINGEPVWSVSEFAL